MPRHIIHHARHLGENLKRLRRSRDWTGERLATEIGVSKGYLSMIETGKRTPHWTVVMRIIHALGETLCSFFTHAESIPFPEDGIRSRREDLIVIEGEIPNERGQITWPPVQQYTHILTPYHKGMNSETVEIFLPPHSEWTAEPVTFGGDVLCYGVQGRVLLELGSGEYILHERECLNYSAAIPHTLRNYTDHPSRALLVITPVSF